MAKKRSKSVMQLEMTRKEFLAFSVVAIASVFGVVGIVKEFSSHAATPAATDEPESGSISPLAKIVSDSAASGGTAIQFGSGDTFVLGVTEPNASNTGVPESKIFAPADIITSNLTITTANTIIDGKEIRGVVTIQAANVIIRNCRIVGPLTGTPVGISLVYCASANCVNFTLQQCTLKPALVSENTNTIYGHNMTRIRNNICNGVDGSDTYAIGGQTMSNITVQGDYIHDLAYYCPSTTHTDHTTHCDVNQQSPGGTGLTYEGCSLHGYWDPTIGNASNGSTINPGLVDLSDPYTASHLQNGKPTTVVSGNRNDVYQVAGIYQTGRLNCNAVFQFNGATTDDIHIINNWIYGGATTCNLADPTLSVQTFEFRGNRVEPPMYGKNQVIRGLTDGSVTVTASGNTYSDGTPLLCTLGSGRYNG